MGETIGYRDAVETIKQAILESQALAARSVNEKQLMLYYAIGGYVSRNTRHGHWGTGAIEAISEGLRKEMPGLRGFSARSVYNMRLFYEEWADKGLAENYTSAYFQIEESAEKKFLDISQLQLRNCVLVAFSEFFAISFTHHITILSQVKDLEERLFYIRQASCNCYSVAALKRAIKADEFHHRGTLANNFAETLSGPEQAFRAVDMFKDEYLLDFINTEELGAREKDVDERLLENRIVHNIKNFILEFGRDFAFVGNQYRIEAFGEEQFVDLLFFNRELNCLVAVELKTGPFKTAYLGQLNSYLSLLDGFVKKEHENPSVGIVLCKDANKSFVDFVIRDYEKPLGVATYKTSKELSQKLIDALPSLDGLRNLLESQE